MQTRRTMMALGAAGLAASCASVGTQARMPRLLLPRVLVAPERVIRVDVGLRPFRPSGFRVAREALGEKTLVHNYGHGGGGITLSWGTAKLAVDLGFDAARPDCAVIGCGAVGLATARLLQERGANVRIYARELPPGTTSNVAGAQWWPASVWTPDRAPDGFMDQLVQAMAFAFRRYQGLVGERYGVSWEPNYHVSDRPIRDYPAVEGGRLAQFVVNQRDLDISEHPFDARYVRVFDTMMIEPPTYLRALEADVRLAGAEIVVRAFNDAAEIAALPERTVFNCSGLGAGALFGDAELEPVRGQLVILEPQPEVNYNVIGNRGLYMFGRRDGVLLGGTFEHGNWSLEPDADTTARLIAGHRRVFEGMAPT